MPLIKNYRTYPVTRDRDGGFHVLTGPKLEDQRGPFDTFEEAQKWVDETLEGIARALDIPAHPADRIGDGRNLGG